MRRYILLPISLLILAVSLLWTQGVVERVGVGSSAWAKPPTRRAEPPASELVLLARYLKVVHDKVQKHWKMKGVPLMAQHVRSAVAQLFINKQGRLIKFRLSQSSGLKSYDRSLIKAIKRANPFPPPTAVIRKYLQTQGQEITFRRRVFRKKLLPLQTRYRGTAVVPNWRPKVDGQRKKKQEDR